MKYAAYDTDAIYGIGTTEEAARKDAIENGLDPHQPAEIIAATANKLKIAPITDALVHQVEQRGGDVGFLIDDGVLKSPSDYDDELTTDEEED